MAPLNNPTTKVAIVSSDGVLSLNGLRMMQGIINALNGSAQNGAQQIALGNGLNLYVGSGNPNGAVSESPPALYFNTAGGAGSTLFVKESGVNTNTGWTGK